MGWVSAVTVCQHIHRNILRSHPPIGAGLPVSRELKRGHRPPHDEKGFLCSYWQVYVDNVDAAQI
eukprot:271801-Amphidinium_carterae.1